MFLDKIAWASEILPLQLWQKENCSVNILTNVCLLIEHDLW